MVTDQRARAKGGAAQQTAQRQAREQLCRGHAHPRRGGMQTRLGGGHIGATAQQLGGRAGSDALWQLRQCRRHVQRRDQSLGHLAGEHGQPVLGHGDPGLQRRNARARALQLRLGARQVEVGAAAVRQPQLHQAQRVLLIRGIGLGQMQALLPAAQIGVAGRDLGRNGDLQRGQVGGTGAQVGAAGLDVATHTTEQVQLPTRVDADAVAALAARPAWCPAWCLAFAASLLQRLTRQGERGELIKTAFSQQGLGRIESRQCTAQLLVGPQSLLDQLRQLPILELAPERRIGTGLGEYLLRDCRRLGPRELRAGWGRLGYAEIGADGAACQQGRKARHGTCQCMPAQGFADIRHGCPPGMRVTQQRPAGRSCEPPANGPTDGAA